MWAEAQLSDEKTSETEKGRVFVQPCAGTTGGSHAAYFLKDPVHSFPVESHFNLSEPSGSILTLIVAIR